MKNTMAQRLRDFQGEHGHFKHCECDTCRLHRAAADEIERLSTLIDTLHLNLQVQDRETGILDSLDFERLRSGDRRALKAEHQPIFDQYYAHEPEKQP